jgi:hypothetical protein
VVKSYDGDEYEMRGEKETGGFPSFDPFQPAAACSSRGERGWKTKNSSRFLSRITQMNVSNNRQLFASKREGEYKGMLLTFRITPEQLCYSCIYSFTTEG